jgi:hypothetical protein
VHAEDIPQQCHCNFSTKPTSFVSSTIHGYLEACGKTRINSPDGTILLLEGKDKAGGCLISGPWLARTSPSVLIRLFPTPCP